MYSATVTLISICGHQAHWYNIWCNQVIFAVFREFSTFEFFMNFYLSKTTEVKLWGVIFYDKWGALHMFSKTVNPESSYEAHYMWWTLLILICRISHFLSKFFSKYIRQKFLRSKIVFHRRTPNFSSYLGVYCLSSV